MCDIHHVCEAQNCERALRVSHLQQLLSKTDEKYGKRDQRFIYALVVSTIFTVRIVMKVITN
jgi:hypothetical protein